MYSLVSILSLLIPILPHPWHMDCVFGFQYLTCGHPLMVVGLDGSFVSSQSLGSDPALGSTKGHQTAVTLANLLVTLIPLKQRKKEGIGWVGGRVGEGRKA